MIRRGRVLLATSSFAEADEAPRRLLTEAGYDLLDNPHRRKLTRAELLALLAPDVVGVVAGLEQYDRAVMERSALRVISRCGSGMSNVDQVAASALGIVVRSTPDAPVDAVAELTVGALLALLRGLPAMDQALHSRKWTKTVGRQLRGSTVVVVGYGRIGRRVGALLSALGARLVAVDPEYTGEPDVPAMPLDDALSRADVVTFHIAGDACVMGEREFAILKPGAIVLNGARGGVVDESALRRALDSGAVSGAWLDCFATEPYDGPLCDYPQVLLTPHVGSYTRECRLRMEAEAAQQLIEALAGV